MNTFQTQHDRNHREVKNEYLFLGLRDHAFSGIPRKGIYTLRSFSWTRIWFLHQVSEDWFTWIHVKLQNYRILKSQNYRYPVGLCCTLCSCYIPPMLKGIKFQLGVAHQWTIVLMLKKTKLPMEILHNIKICLSSIQGCSTVYLAQQARITLLQDSVRNLKNL